VTRSPRRAMSAYVVACLMFGLGCKPSPQPASPTRVAQAEGDQRSVGVLPQDTAKPEGVVDRKDPQAVEPAVSADAPVRDEEAPAPKSRRALEAKDDGVEALLGRPMKKEVATQPLGQDVTLRARGYGSGSVGLGTLGTTAAGGVAHGALGRKTANRMAIAEPLAAPPPSTPAEFNTEAYAHHKDNDFFAVKDTPLSTFSIDVDTASYSNMRRFLNQGTRPPADAVRIEELINYFRYDYAPPHDGKPFSVHAEVGSCPWAKDHRLVHIGVQGKTLDDGKVPPRNLVFLVDVSGSMDEPNKLPLLKRGLRMLVENLRAQDKLAMVVYAGASGVALPTTSGGNHGRILEAIDRLEAGGSTNGGEGIELAYKLAQTQFDKTGINRVILATDGDFNVGCHERRRAHALDRREAQERRCS